MQRYSALMSWICLLAFVNLANCLPFDLPDSITFEEVQEGINEGTMLLIDVRPEGDVAKFGKIPTSYAVPIDQVPEAFSPETSDEEFEETYGVARPGLDDPFVLYCRQGVGARAAESILKGLGYTNMRVYDGSFKEWTERGAKIVGKLTDSISFEEVQEGVNDGTMLLIDVRPEGDVEKFGKIPTSYAVPITQVPKAFSELSDEEFEETYGFAKPGLDDPFVLYCRQGLGARAANVILKGLGYTNIRVYDGSFREWRQKGGEIERKDSDSISFEEVQEGIEEGTILLIDVRPEGDVEKFGKIPKSYSVPITQVPNAFSDEMSDEEFEETYGFAKPGLEDPFVLYCRQGLGARAAQIILKSYGYTNMRVYDGSFKEWKAKGGTIELEI